MLIKIVRNDIAKSKFPTVITAVFIAIASLLVSLAAILVVNLVGSIDTVMVRAKTPHFLQMHDGPLDKDRLERFAGQDERVSNFQIMEFVNIESDKIVLGDTSLASSTQDNGIVTQSESFDYLLNLNGEVIRPNAGDLYVPIAYMKDGSARVGDTALIAGHELTIRGFLRDSQMNSTLSSSKRFLVSDDDFAAIRDKGTPEWLIEFRLKDRSTLGAFESSYSAAGLENNGPTITYPLFRIINAISDGLVILVLLLVSLLVVCVSLLCVRLTLLTKLEEDYREIGVMKAIGIRLGDIKKLYIAKYVAIALLGSAVGYALSLLFQGMLLENIHLYMGKSSNAGLAPVLAIAGVIIIVAAIYVYVWLVLNRLKRVAPAQAIRQGFTGGTKPGARWMRLSGSRLPVPLYLGFKDALSGVRLHSTLAILFTLAVLMVLLPYSLYQTISDRDFVSHMGVGNSDIRIDIQQTDDIEGKTAALVAGLRNDAAIREFSTTTTKTFTTKLADGTESRLKIDVGDHTKFPPQYATGSIPDSPREIALSVLNAQELNKKVGETITLSYNGVDTELVLSGIYSDVTNGGKTAKAVFDAPDLAPLRSTINLSLDDPATTTQVVDTLESRYPDAKIVSVQEYMAQTFGSTTRAVGDIYRVSLVVALALVFLITLLSVRMFVAKNSGTIAIQKATGFTSRDIVVQYIARILSVLAIALVVGTLLNQLLGGRLIGLLLSPLGAGSVHLQSELWFVYGVLPITTIVVTIIAVILGARAARHITIARHIKE